MRALRVRNLRSLVDTGMIPIKPITLLVGANSSGKSTFLRTLPLLRQSMGARTVSGLLLNGEDADFGLFTDAVRRDASPHRLSLAFELILRRVDPVSLYQVVPLIRPVRAEYDISYISRAGDEKYPAIDAITISLIHPDHTDRISIDVDSNGSITHLGVNADQFSGSVAKLGITGNKGIVPFIGRSSNQDGSVIDDEGSDESGGKFFFDDLLVRNTYNFFHGNTTGRRKLHGLRAIGIGSPIDMLERAKNNIDIPTWRQSVSHWNTDSPDFTRVRNLLIGRAIGDILRGIGSSLAQHMRHIHYFRPVRANALRDYASRDVQIQNVDSSGLNVPLMLAGLEKRALAKFREWTLDNFAFEVFPQPVSDGARTSIRMRERDSSNEFNLVDMGFGFSQMLPFILQMWRIANPKLLFESFQTRFVHVPDIAIVAIEQPELHLHPEMQSKIADLIVNAVRTSRESKSPVSFFIETHSQTIVERIGAHVEARTVNPADVQLLLFERELDANKQMVSTVRTASFDEHGILQDWPFGFLSARPSLIK